MRAPHKPPIARLCFAVVIAMTMSGIPPEHVKAQTVTFRYPYAAGRNYAITQGPHGSFSHKSGTYAESAYDFAIPDREPVVAVADGEVIAANDSFGVGGCDLKYASLVNRLIVRHADGTDTLYLHLLQGSIVKRSGTVKAGDPIGLSDTSGYTCNNAGGPGPHLHIQRQRGSTTAGWWKQSIEMNFAGPQQEGKSAPPAVPPARPKVVLDPHGLGVASFGDSLSAASNRLNGALGPADRVTPWVTQFCATGEGAGGQSMVWGELEVLFNDASTDSKRALWGWTYGGVIEDEHGRVVRPSRRLNLRTASGIGLGSSGLDIERVHGSRARFDEGDPNGFPPPSYTIGYSDGSDAYVSGSYLHLVLDANDRAGKVTVISGGRGCGE